MSHGVAARKRFGGVGFALGCGCKDPKAVAVAVAASSPRSGTEASTATTATSRRARTHPSASTSTGTLTVPSASSSFLWEDADADADEVECKRESSATTPSFSGLLRELSELERSIKSDDKPSIQEGHGDFSPPRPRPLPPQSLQVPTQQHRRVKSVDKASKQGDAHFTPLPPRPLPPPPPPEPLQNAKTEEDKSKNKEDEKRSSTPQPAPKHRKANSCDNNNGFGSGGGGRLDGSVAVVKQSEDPLSDFRRSMLNMIVENGIVTGDELRELLRRFLALNAPRHHDAIFRAFTEIWDEVFAPATADREPKPTARPTAPRQRTPPRRRQPLPLPAWRV